jgi:hypothetical protein
MTTFDRACWLREGDETLSLGQIAKQIGVSRQRVYQILKEDGLPTAGIFTSKFPPCPGCGKPRPWRHRHELCNNCRTKRASVQFSCDTCLVIFSRQSYRSPFNPNRVTQNHTFCSKRCQGKYLAAHHGFGVHPENATPGHQRKYDYDLAQIDARHAEGVPYAQEARRLGVPPYAVYGAVRRRKRKTVR